MRFGAAFFVALALSAPGLAQNVNGQDVSGPNVSGKWSVIVTTDQGTTPAELTLTKDGSKVTGLVAGEAGEVPLTGEQKAKEVTLTFTYPSNDGPVNVTMTGTQDGDAMGGSLDFGGRGQMAWTAKRTAAAAPAQAKPPEKGGEKPAETAGGISGTWGLTVEIAGNSATPTVTLKQEGEKLTGRYLGQVGEYDVTGSVTGASFSFSFQAAYEGNTLVVTYAGTFEKDSMKGTATFGELGEGAFSGVRKPAK